MGRRDRERIERIKIGDEAPIGIKMKMGADSVHERIAHCLVCKTFCVDHLALAHVKQCWGMEYPDRQSIPLTPPPEAFEYHEKKMEEAKAESEYMFGPKTQEDVKLRMS